MFGYSVQVSRMLPCALSTVLVAQALCSKALSDKEEWVSMIGRALGAFDGRAHADAVGKGSAAVSLSYFVYLWACKSTPVECSADSRLKTQHHLCCLRRQFASWHGRSWVSAAGEGRYEDTGRADSNSNAQMACGLWRYCASSS